MSTKVLIRSIVSLNNNNSIIMEDSNNNKTVPKTTSDISSILKAVNDAKGVKSPPPPSLFMGDAKQVTQTLSPGGSITSSTGGLTSTTTTAGTSVASSNGQKETDIVSHLRRSTSSGSRQDAESTLRSKALAASSALLAASPIAGSSTTSRSLATLPGYVAPTMANNNSTAAMNGNIMASLILQGQLSREFLLSQAAMQNQLSLNNALLAARFGMNNLGNLTATAAAAGLTGVPRGLNNSIFFTGGNVGVNVSKPRRRPITLYMECDMDSLSEYQCLIRQQIELFEADKLEAASSVQGRNKQVVEGQIGIRCRHCANIPPRKRQKGSMYFPTKLDRIYQAAQNLSGFHLCENCEHVPEPLRKRILLLRERKSPAGGGKRYWGEGVRCLGVVEDQTGLRFS